MADMRLGRSQPLLPATKLVDRAGTATDRDRRRGQQSHDEAADRRRKEDGHPRRRFLFDLLFDEIDNLPALNERQRGRIKENIRSQLAARTARQHGAPSPPAPEALPADEEALARELMARHFPGEAPSTPAEDAGPSPEAPPEAPPIDHEHVVQFAAPLHPHLPPDEAEENRLLAEQLRECLALNTDTARRVAVYLHLLLGLNGALRPRLIVDI